MSNSGSNATAAVTLTLPAAPSNGDVCDFLASTAGALVILAAGTQKIRQGTVISAAGGSATSSTIGASMHLVYMATGTTWYAIGGPQGTWNIV